MFFISLKEKLDIKVSNLLFNDLTKNVIDLDKTNNLNVFLCSLRMIMIIYTKNVTETIRIDFISELKLFT